MKSQNNLTKGLIDVIIINYNGGDEVIKCIESVIIQSYKNHEITIVDNDSKDGSLDNIKSKYPFVKIIETGYNSGWGVACNEGIKNSNGEYISLLNNDAYLDSNCLNEMVKAINIKDEYGSCASKILLWNEPEKIEVVGLSIYKDGSSVGRGRLQSSEKYDISEEVFCANDCVCLYKREMISNVGLYDPDFFIYADETDMGWRHQIAGWKCIYTPKAIAYHAHSRAAGDYSDFKAYHVERNRLYIVFKYFPYWNIISSFIYSTYRYLYQVRLIKKGKGSLAKYREKFSLFHGLIVLAKAHIDAFKKLPVMLKRRRKYNKEIKKISNKDIRELFLKYGISGKQLATYE
jgi:GT2 family glycosyltransferase